MAVDIKVPSLGESVTEATVGKWFKAAGDAVKVDEALCELETDKVTVEVPAPVSGVLAEIKVAEGATVAVGSVLGSIKEGAAATTSQPAAKSEAPAAKPQAHEAGITFAFPNRSRALRSCLVNLSPCRPSLLVRIFWQ
jgi:2-oxoglutarate dehydrogenase E2 component (dihydrolipoamide succinyltransferase)